MRRKLTCYSYTCNCATACRQSIPSLHWANRRERASRKSAKNNNAIATSSHRLDEFALLQARLNNGEIICPRGWGGGVKKVGSWERSVVLAISLSIITYLNIIVIYLNDDITVMHLKIWLVRVLGRHRDSGTRCQREHQKSPACLSTLLISSCYAWHPGPYTARIRWQRLTWSEQCSTLPEK